MRNHDGFLVVGSDGLIGQALLQHLSNQHRDVCGTTRRSDRLSSQRIFLDLARDVADWRLPANCSVAFLCAAITSQAICNQDPSLTRQLNVTRTVDLARVLAKAGVFVVFLSTNLVFDGGKPSFPSDDVPNPQTEYGRQKAEAEQALLAMDKNVAVVRLTKVFHAEMPLLKKWADALRKKEAITPLNDLYCSPISLDFVIRALEQIGNRRPSGKFQISGDRDVSYADIALRLAHRLGAEGDLVKPASSREIGVQLEHLPRHTTLDVSRLASQLEIPPPTVDAALDSVFAGLLSSGARPAGSKGDPVG